MPIGMDLFSENVKGSPAGAICLPVKKLGLFV